MKPEKFNPFASCRHTELSVGGFKLKGACGT
jgi:hypothetical protein